MRQADWARELTCALLSTTLPRRWAHSQGAAVQARSLAVLLGKHADLLEAAAWLHDIGYAPGVAVTGFHPLDGARYLRDIANADRLLCRLVAHHSCAIIEAEERGIAQTLSSEFQPANPLLSDALIYCDMTTTPGGAQTSVDVRLAEILVRYGPSHVVSRAIQRSSGHLKLAADRITERLV